MHHVDPAIYRWDEAIAERMIPVVRPDHGLALIARLYPGVSEADLAEIARRSARLEHPGLWFVCDQGLRTPELPFLLGESLVAPVAIADAETWVAVLVQVLEALQFMHDRGICYGRICADCVWWSASAGGAKLVPGEGWPHWKGDIGKSQDLFSLGRLAWAWATGGEIPADDEPLPALPWRFPAAPGMEEWVARMTLLWPFGRFRSASEAREALSLAPAWREPVDPRLYEIGACLLPHRPLPLVGRARELALLEDFVQGPRGEVLILRGPGGVGRSRLLDEVALRSLGQVFWLHVEAEPGGAGALSSALNRFLGLDSATRDVEEAIESRLGWLGAPDALEAARRAVEDPVHARDFVVQLARTRRVVLRIEDGHEQGEVIPLVVSLLESNVDVVALVEGVHRAEERTVSASHSSRWARLLSHPRAKVVEVAPLDDAAIGELVNHLYQSVPTLDRQGVIRESRGLAFAAHQLVLGLAEGSVSAVCDWRAALAQRTTWAISSEKGPQWLAIAARLPLRVNATLWNRACGDEQGEPRNALVDKLLAAGLAVDSEGGWSFAHPLVREAFETPDAPVAVGKGRYRIFESLGKGGMAVVYRGFDLRLGVERAVKILNKADDVTRQRFENESRVMARLHHPHAVGVHDSGVEEGFAWMVLDLMSGGSLMDLMRRRGPFPLDEAAKILTAVLDALAAAHALGIVHRDIKPHNVLLDLQGTAKVADFGIATRADPGKALTETGAGIGTAAYMAPEQHSDAKNVGPAADLFSAGLMLFALVTGKSPMLYRDGLEELGPPIPEAVADFVKKATAPRPQDRYASAAEMSRALQDALSSGTRSTRKQRKILGMVLMAGVGVAALAWGARWAFQEDRTPPQWQTTRVTATANSELEPSISPDGKRLVWASNLSGEGQFDLIGANIDGSDQVALTHTPVDEFYPRFSPDGSTLLFSRYAEVTESAGTEIWTLKEGKETRVVDSGLYGAWSGDGTEILFARVVRTGTAQLVRRSLITGEEQGILEWPGEIWSIDWAKNGQVAAFATARGAVVVDLPTGEHRTLREGRWISGLAFADSDGEVLVVSHSGNGGQPELWWTRVDTGEGERMTLGSVGAVEPDVQPQGESVVYLSSQRWTRLWVAADGQPAERLTASDGIKCFDVDAAGSRMAWTEVTPGLGDTTLRVAELPTGTPRVYPVEGCPAFAPDGRRVAMVSQTAGTVVVVDLETSAVEEKFSGLKTTQAQVTAEWSNDGKRLALADTEGLRLLAADGRVQRFGEGTLVGPAFSPDDRWVAINRVDEPHSGLWLIDVNNGEFRRLTEQHSWSNAPRWSEDGSRLWMLVDEREAPAEQEVRLDGTLGEKRVIPVNRESSWWGVFETRTAGNRTYFAQGTVDSDLFLLTRESQKR